MPAAPNAALVHNQDLQLLITLIKYKKADENVLKFAINKLVNHLWYLNHEQVAFASFLYDLKKHENHNGQQVISFQEIRDTQITRKKKIVKAKIPLKVINSFLQESGLLPSTLNYQLNFLIPILVFENKYLDFLERKTYCRKS